MENRGQKAELNGNGNGTFGWGRLRINPGTVLLFLSYLVATVIWAVQIKSDQAVDHGRLEELRLRIEGIDQSGSRGAGLALQRLSTLESSQATQDTRIDRNVVRIDELVRELGELKIRLQFLQQRIEARPNP